MNTLLAMKIPRRARISLCSWALLLAFLLPCHLVAATDDASATDWAAERVEVEQRHRGSRPLHHVYPQEISQAIHDYNSGKFGRIAH